MKKLTTTFATLALAFTINTGVQAQKIAHIAVDSLLTTMPEYNKAKEIGSKIAKELEQMLTKMQSELEEKNAAYQTNPPTSEVIKKAAEDEIQSIYQRIQDSRANAQQEYQKKSGELTKLLYEKAKKAIDAVAKEAGYKYVLDTSSGVVIYFESSDDIFLAVKKKLLSMPVLILPGEENLAPATPKPTANGPKPTPGKPIPPEKTGK